MNVNVVFLGIILLQKNIKVVQNGEKSNGVLQGWTEVYQEMFCVWNVKNMRFTEESLMRITLKNLSQVSYGYS